LRNELSLTSKDFGKLTIWLGMSCFFPLFFLVVGVAVAYLQSTNPRFVELVGTTELYFFSLAIWGSTFSDFHNAELKNRDDWFVRFLFLVQVFFLVGSAGFFAITYIHERVQPLGFQQLQIATLAVVLAVITIVVCFLIQVFLTFVSGHD